MSMFPLFPTLEKDLWIFVFLYFIVPNSQKKKDEEGVLWEFFKIDR